MTEVQEALASHGIQGMTVTEVSGAGQQGGHGELYRGAHYSVELEPKLKLEILAADDQVAAISAIIEAAAHTGQIGDGKIVISRLEEVVRIRTGERGPAAI